MAKRKFALPGIQELSKEQEDARALPKKGKHLIFGGPGTGKSVLALLRSRRHHVDKDNYLFLVFNRLLHQASRHLLNDALTSRTWQSWFSGFFNECTKQSIPLLPPKQETDWRNIDWENALRIIADLAPPKNPDLLPFLIIDEGQDMPPQFYQSLTQLEFNNIYVVADQNQQIISGSNSSRRDIEIELDISTDNVIELKVNYRNSYQTARLAREFYPDDPASPPPDLPPIKRTAKMPLLVEYGKRCSFNFTSVIHAILKTADRDPSKLLGIIAPDNAVRRRYFDGLSNVNLKLDNGTPKIQTYQSGNDSAKLTFNEGGIMVINAQSCKGLEFDVVLLADIDQHYCTPLLMDEKKRLFYVMVARARENVIMLKNGDNKHCPVDAIIPQNPEILEIRR